MEFPTKDEFAKEVAEKALDEFIYEGKTIREWVEILVKQQPCEDCISRQELLEELGEEPFNWNDSPEAIQEVRDYQWFRSLVENAQPVTPKVEPCEDCVSRQETVDIINGYAEQFNGYIGTPNDTEVYAYARGLLLGIESNISALPSVKPKGETITDFADRCRECGAKYGKLLKSKTGSWIIHHKGGFAYLVCSNCLSYAPLDCKTNYCPDCGSRMIELQESESDD